jgi:hypothetical protein
MMIERQRRLGFVAFAFFAICVVGFSATGSAVPQQWGSKVNKEDFKVTIDRFLDAAQEEEPFASLRGQDDGGLISNGKITFARKSLVSAPGADKCQILEDSETRPPYFYVACSTTYESTGKARDAFQALTKLLADATGWKGQQDIKSSPGVRSMQFCVRNGSGKCQFSKDFVMFDANQGDAKVFFFVYGRSMPNSVIGR